MENLTPSTKTIRVSYCDPDATDSSSDEGSGKSQKRKVHEIEVEFVQKKHDPRSDSGDVLEETGFKKPNMTSEGERMFGVKKTRSGKKFWVEIRDPIKGRWVWRGVFGTAEAASTAYLFQESNIAAAKLTAGQRVESAGSQNPHLVVLDRHSRPTSAGKKFEGVLMTKSGKYGASVKDPFKRKQVWLGSFATAEEASRAYLAKKAQLEADKLRVEKLRFEAKMLRDKLRIDRVASGKSTLQDSASSVLGNGTSDLTSFQGVARTKLSYIRRTKYGKFSAEITDPITKRCVYIATFATEEEAYSAYFAKEAEFAAELRANRKIDGVASGKSTFQDSVSSVLRNDTLNLTSFREGARTRISDGRRRNSCNFSAEIAEPINTTRDWIDTSATAESASRAYPTQESKFVAVEKLRAKQAASQNSPFQDLVPQTIARKKKEGVWRWKSGKFGVSIRDPFKKKFVSLGPFTTAEEAYRAYLAKKAQIEAKQLRIQKSQLEAKMLRAKQRMERVASGKSTLQDSASSVLGNGTLELASFQGVARTKISDIRRTKSGKFSAEMTDPITKRRVYIATFATEEEAYSAYFSKEAEFAAEKLRANRKIDGVASGKSTFQDSVSSVLGNDTLDFTTFQVGARTRISDGRRRNSGKSTFRGGARTRISGVYRTNSGKYSAVIEHPITKRRVRIGTFASKQKAQMAYRAKEAEFEEELKAKQPFERDQEAGFGFFNGVQVVDKNGFLVGEFSVLDDFSICS